MIKISSIIESVADSLTGLLIYQFSLLTTNKIYYYKKIYIAKSIHEHIKSKFSCILCLTTKYDRDASNQKNVVNSSGGGVD